MKTFVFSFGSICNEFITHPISPRFS